MFEKYVVELNVPPKKIKWSLSDLRQDMKLFEILVKDDMYHDSWV